MSLPYFRWWFKDYNGDPLVQAMTDDQDLAYRRMIEATWELGPLPPEPEKLARIVRFSPEKFETVWTFPLIECWHQNGNGLLTNSRLEIEKKRAKKEYKSRVDNGRKGGRPPKPKKTKEKSGNRTKTGRFSTETEPKPTANRELTESKANHNQIHNHNQEEEEKRIESADADSWRAGISWEKEKLEVAFTDDAKEGLREHLEALAASESLPMLSNQEMRYHWGTLNVHLRGNRMKTGPKSLAPIVVGWFENDLRRRGLNKAPPQKTPAQQWVEDEVVTYEAYQTDTDEEVKAARIAACEKEHGSHEERELMKGSHWKICPKQCGYRARL